jgi:hypothetical protein
MELLRNQIKHHFLNQIIFRLDYEGLLEKDVEECVFNLRQKFYGAGFAHMNRRAENQVIELSKNFFTLTIEVDKEYKTFDKYISLLAESIEFIKVCKRRILY